MEVSYKRSADQNYLVLEEDNFQDWYQVGMITRNKIPGFLSCYLSQIDGKAMFFYEITSRQSLSLTLERKRLSARELTKLLESLQGAVRTCQEYLLDADRLLLEPDYIYLDSDGWQFSFCYFPFGESEIHEELQSLAEYLLDRLDRQDQRAVALAYEFYRAAGDVNSSLESCLLGWEEEEIRGQENAEEGVETGSDLLREALGEMVLEERSGTALLSETSSGTLFLRSLNPAYQSMRITGESFLIGKKKDAVDGWLKARGISRIHGKISKEGEVYYLSDLNSTNGTFLNGGRLEVNEKARIRAGDCVGFAEVEYLVEYRDEA